MSESYFSTNHKILDELEGLQNNTEKIRQLTSQLIHTERMTALGELTSSIAHELNQPLNNMKIISQDILRDIKMDRLEIETIPESIEDIVDQINRMSKIIDHMRIFTRRLDGNETREKASVNQVIDNVMMLMGEQLKTRNIEIIKDLDYNSPMIVMNEMAIEQVFTNILINARNAVETYCDMNGKIEIKCYMKGDESVAISFWNNGGGISSEHKARIFEPFFTTKEPGKGTGLGLSISRKIIEEHEGTIEVETGEGWTKFIVILPVTDTYPEEVI